MNRLLIDKKAASESRYVALAEFVNRRLEHTNALVEKLTINNKYVTIKDKMLLHTIVSEEDGATDEYAYDSFPLCVNENEATVEPQYYHFI